MAAFVNGCTRSWVLSLALIAMVTVPCHSFADDGTSDTKADTKPDTSASNSPAKTAPAKPEAPEPMTERERYLLDQLVELKQRVAELEAKLTDEQAATDRSLEIIRKLEAENAELKALVQQHQTYQTKQGVK